MLGDVKLREISQLKKMSSIFFHSFKKILAAHFTNTFQKMKHYCTIIFKDGSASQICNMILLISDMADLNYLEKNIYYDAAEDGDYHLMGDMLQIVLQFIDFYRGSGGQTDLFDLCILVFI